MNGPATHAVIEVHVPSAAHLFHPFDPAPLVERDLASDVEAFILDWAAELPQRKPVALRFYVDTAPAGDLAAVVPDAVGNYFANREAASRRELRSILRQGRLSLAIGVTFLFACIGAGRLLAPALGGFAGEVLEEGFLISGWVAMWRPIQIFLYDWWPILGTARRCARLSRAPVEIVEGSPAAERPLRTVARK